MESETLIDGKEVGRRLDHHYYTILKWAAAGKIPSIRLGKRLKFDFVRVLAALGIKPAERANNEGPAA